MMQAKSNNRAKGQNTKCSHTCHWPPLLSGTSEQLSAGLQPEARQCKAVLR